VTPYPSWWSGGSFDAKAAWLKQTGRARDYSHACQILGARGRKKAALVRKPTVAAYQLGLEKRGLDWINA